LGVFPKFCLSIFFFTPGTRLPFSSHPFLLSWVYSSEVPLSPSSRTVTLPTQSSFLRERLRTLGTFCVHQCGGFFFFFPTHPPLPFPRTYICCICFKDYSIFPPLFFHMLILSTPPFLPWYDSWPTFFLVWLDGFKC